MRLKLHKKLWIGLLSVSLPLSWSAASAPPRVPLGLDEFIPIPEDNRPTPAKVELGRQLFFDKRLSRDGTVSCATCHIPERAFTDGKRLAVGVEGRVGRRHAPTLLNRAYGRTFFWDGRAKALEEQPLEAILNPNEMGLTVTELSRRLDELNAGKSYRERLQEAFGEPASAQTLRGRTETKGLTTDFADERGPRENDIRSQNFDKLDPASQMALENTAKAIAAYVRTLLSGNSAFDRYEHGDQSALSEEAKRGLQIFRGKGNCIACHSGPLLSDEDFHNTGVSWNKEPLDLGRYRFTQREGDRGRFKAPTLRNLTLTAPYMHDGSLATLEEVIEFYNKGGQPNPYLDRELRPLNLTPDERADLIEFLRSLGESDLHRVFREATNNQ